METLYTHDILYCSRGISIHWTNISVPHQASNMKVRIIIVALLQHRCVQNDSGPRWIKILFNSQISNISESSVFQMKHNRKRNKEWTFLLASFINISNHMHTIEFIMSAKLLCQKNIQRFIYIFCNTEGYVTMNAFLHLFISAAIYNVTESIETHWPS